MHWIPSPTPHQEDVSTSSTDTLNALLERVARLANQTPLLGRLAFRTGPPGDHGLCEEMILLRCPGPGRGQVWRLSTWSTAAAVPAGHRSTAIRPLLQTS